MPKRCQNGSPKGYQNPSKIVKKSSLSRRGLPQATSDLPEGTPPQKGRKSTEFCTNSGRNFGRVQLLIVPPKLKKKWRALRPVFVALGGASPQAEYWVLALTPKLKKKWRALPPVFLALGGASPQAEYWLRNDAMPDASQKKNARPVLYTWAGVLHLRQGLSHKRPHDCTRHLESFDLDSARISR